MKHKEEYALSKTCQAWTEKEAMKEASWAVKLMFKDCHGKASLVEQVAIEIDYLLGYNNVDHIPENEVLEKAQEIIDMVRGGNYNLIPKYMTTEKMIKMLSRFLQTTAAIFSGAVVNSLWISHTDGWQISMPIVLLCLTLERYIVRD